MENRRSYDGRRLDRCREPLQPPAKEQAGEVSHEMLGAWMLRNQLSLSGAAEALGISRRMVSYYKTAAKAIPRSIWLACLGREATRPKANALPRGLPSAREYAVAHA